MPSSSIAAAVRVAEAAEAAAEVLVAQAALLYWRKKTSPFWPPRPAKVTRPKGLWDALLPKDALPRAQQASTHHVTWG